VKSKTKNGPKARAKAATKTSGGLIPLKRICADLGLDPKKSRVRLRRAWRRTDAKGRAEGNVAFHEKGARWDLTKAEAAEVRAILAG
jgi:hypothetical protein